MQLDYQIKIFDQFGNYLHDIDDYQEFEVTRIKNDIGTFTIVLNTINHSIHDYRADYIAEVYRKDKLIGNTCWFLQRKELAQDDEGKALITLTFADTIDIISRRINAWFSCDNPQCFGALQDLADDMMKMLMKFNFGSLVDPSTDPAVTPDVSPGASPVSVQGVPPAVSIVYNEIYNTLDARQMGIIIDEYRSEGVLVANEVSFVDVLSALQDIANTSLAIRMDDLTHNIWFDIEYVPATIYSEREFIFKTWIKHRGNDLRSSVFIGPEYGNLSEPVYIDDYSQRGDIAYVLSDGDNNTQTVGVAYLNKIDNAYYYTLPFGPIELVTDFSQDNAAQELLEGEGLAVLGNASKTKSLNGTIIVSKNFDFMDHFNYGDLLSLRWSDVQEDVEVAEFTINVNEDGIEEITIPLVIIND